MKKIGFVLRDVWQQIVYERFMSAVVFLALLAGIFFLLFGVNGISDLQANARLSRYENVEQLRILDVNQMYEEPEEIDKRIAECVEKGVITDAGYYAISRQIVYGRTDSFSIYVNAASQHYFDVDGNELIDGRFFTEEEVNEGAAVCMLSHNGSLEEDGVRVGDMVTILGTDYEVVGILRAPKMHGGVILPYRAGKAMLSMGSNQYHMLVYTNSERRIQDKVLLQTLFPNGSGSVETGEETERMYLDSVSHYSRRRALECACVLFFTCVSMVLLLVGKTVAGRYRMGVRLAVGAGRSSIRRQEMLQNLLLMMVAFVVDALLYGKIAGTVRGMNPYLHGNTLLFVPLVCGGMLSVISYGAVSYCLHGNSVNALLRRCV